MLEFGDYWNCGSGIVCSKFSITGLNTALPDQVWKCINTGNGTLKYWNSALMPRGKCTYKPVSSTEIM